jgi:hypothetical protein
LKELTPTFFPGNKRNALLIIDNYKGKNGEEWITVRGGGVVNRSFNPGKYSVELL